ncbi:hypothetical protein MIND_01113200 [Mycena indigotica]|uniref:Wax synthase domain-containing protein n=1 Tax=Mycena indigotica TaxID=2126181 RepID=A0A8H6VXP8_9AGAR|nr:uncharacterized protein MIND_01113200 [Mycena indigotica]KAF7295726.1 hypothetical protein MIND_01113200 [Mycena indigotica]
MFFWLALVAHARTANAVAGAFDAAGMTGCTDNCRTLYDIVSGCLLTIFACVWVSIHPNVPKPPALAEPGPDTSIVARLRWKLVHGTHPFRARLKLMLVGVLAPELIVGLALRQNAMATRFSTLLGVSKTHGFFIGMGGLVSVDGDPLVTGEQVAGQHLVYFHSQKKPDMNHPTVAAIQAIPREVITDKSKGDVYSKALALSQSLWFILQCLVRLVQRLPLTQLEVATLAFTAVNFFTWVVWWDKPLDVAEPFVVVGNTVRVQQPVMRKRVSGPALMPFRRRFLRLLGFRQWWDGFDPQRMRAVPTFWFGWGYDTPPGLEHICLVRELLVACLFGAIHCAAWRAAFPSTAEMQIWRVTAKMLAVVPLVAICILQLGLDSWFIVGDNSWTVTQKIIQALLLLYLPSRLVTLVLPFAALRTVNPLVYVDVDWSVYIPHLGG